MPRFSTKGMNEEEVFHTNYLLDLERRERQRQYRKKNNQRKKKEKKKKENTFSIKQGTFHPFREDHIREFGENYKQILLNYAFCS